MDTWGAQNRRSDAPPALQVRLFGPLEIEDGARVLGPRDLGGSRPKQVLEILLAARGHRVPTDRLVDLRGTYQGRVLGAHLEAADAALAELDYAAAHAHTEAAAALDGFSERAHRTAMLALYALGRQPLGAPTRAQEGAGRP